MTRNHIWIAWVVVLVALVVFVLLGCTPPGAYVPDVDVVGDSTLQMAQEAEPIDNARGFWGTSPHNAADQLLADKVLWVYVGTNIGAGLPGPEDDVQVIKDACVSRHCMVTLQGVDPAYDALIEETGLAICDLRPLGLWRYDGVHTDETSTRRMAAAVRDCQNGLRWMTTGRAER